jgi:hypothetical protein
MADVLVAAGAGIALTLLAVPGTAAITALPVAPDPLAGVPLPGARHPAALAMLRAPGASRGGPNRAARRAFPPRYSAAFAIGLFGCVVQFA